MQEITLKNLKRLESVVNFSLGKIIRSVSSSREMITKQSLHLINGKVEFYNEHLNKRLAIAGIDKEFLLFDETVNGLLFISTIVAVLLPPSTPVMVLGSAVTVKTFENIKKASDSFIAFENYIGELQKSWAPTEYSAKSSSVSSHVTQSQLKNLVSLKYPHSIFDYKINLPERQLGAVTNKNFPLKILDWVADSQADLEKELDRIKQEIGVKLLVIREILESGEQLPPEYYDYYQGLVSFLEKEHGKFLNLKPQDFPVYRKNIGQAIEANVRNTWLVTEYSLIFVVFTLMITMSLGINLNAASRADELSNRPPFMDAYDSLREKGIYIDESSTLGQGYYAILQAYNDMVANIKSNRYALDNYAEELMNSLLENYIQGTYFAEDDQLTKMRIRENLIDEMAALELILFEYR